MSIACHVYLPPFLFFLAVFFTLTIFAAAVLFATFGASLELKIWGFLGGLESFNRRMLVYATSEVQTQMTAAKAGLARATLFFWFRHVKMLLL